MTCAYGLRLLSFDSMTCAYGLRLLGFDSMTCAHGLRLLHFDNMTCAYGLGLVTHDMPIVCNCRTIAASQHPGPELGGNQVRGLGGMAGGGGGINLFSGF